MPTVIAVFWFVCTDHWLELPTISAMRFELASLVTLSLLQIWGTSLCKAQQTRPMRHVLNLHNLFRRRAALEFHVANMNTLHWSNQLAARAEERVRCKSWRERRRTGFGSNANVDKVRTNRQQTLDTLINNWFTQKDRFNHTPEFDGCSPWDSCLKFRAMINARHHSIGCSLLPSCGRRRHYSVLLCFYEGGSSNEDSFDFLYGPTCSKCESPLSFCRNGLCATCDQEDRNQCECHKNCIKEGVGRGRLNSTSCTCDCEYGMGPNCDEPCRNPPNLIGLDLCRSFAEAQNDPAQRNHVAPLDCQLFGRFCPEQCSCQPWPGTEYSHRDDSINADVIEAVNDYDFIEGDVDDGAVLYFM